MTNNENKKIDWKAWASLLLGVLAISGAFLPPVFLDIGNPAVFITAAVLIFCCGIFIGYWWHGRTLNHAIALQDARINTEAKIEASRIVEQERNDLIQFIAGYDDFTLSFICELYFSSDPVKVASGKKRLWYQAQNLMTQGVIFQVTEDARANYEWSLAPKTRRMIKKNEEIFVAECQKRDVSGDLVVALRNHLDKKRSAE